MADAIADLVARLRAKLGQDGATVSAVDEAEREVRGQWGGQWSYVAQSPDVRARNSAIVNARLKGRSIGQIARDFGLSKRQVLRILAKGA